MRIMCINKLPDSVAQFLDAGEDASIKGSTSRLANQHSTAFSHEALVGPKGQRDAQVLGQPSTNPSRFMRRSVIQDYMQIQLRR